MSQIFFQTFGNETLPDLVLVHGWASNGAIWQSLVPALSERFHVTVVDLPTLGRSDTNDVHSSTEAICALAAVVPEQAVWVGWSLGGQLAIEFAHTYPDRVLALSLIASNPCFVAHEHWPNAMTQSVFEQFGAMLKTRPSKALGRFKRLQVLGSVTAEQELELLNIVAQLDSDGLEFGTSLNWLASDMTNAFSALMCPVQAILGDQDAIVPVTVRADLEKCLPHLDIHVIADSGHLPFVKDQAGVLSLVSEFAAKVTR